MADGFEVGVAYIRVSPDTEGFAEELESKVEEATAGAEGKVRVGADDEELRAVLDDAKAKLDELDGAEATAALGLDAGEFDAGRDDATAKLREFGESEATAKLRLDAADFDAESDDAEAKLDEFDGREAEANLILNKAEWDATIADANAQLDELKAKASSVNLGGAGGRRGSGGGENGGEGSLLGAAALGVGGLLPGVGGAAAGLGLLGATGFLALGGVGSALSAAHQASLNVGLTPQQVAAQQFSNSAQVQQAQVSVTQAKQQQAQDALTANDQIKSSEMNLAETERNTAASEVQAMQSVTQAKQQVQAATYSLSEAEYNYSQAVVQARLNIISLNDQLADSKLSVQSASLAVQQAEYQEKLVNQSAYSTSLDRQQAALGVAQAKQQLQDATDQESASQYNANLANKQGVEGSQQVIQAKQAVTSAQYQMTDATASAAQAETALKNTQLNSAAQVRQAQMQLQQAQEQAAYQARQDAESVANAERNLTNTIREQQLQWASMMSTQNQAAQQFAMYMRKLTPRARSLVNEILGMKGAYDGLKTAAQNAVVPGLSVFVAGLARDMPVAQAAVTQMGGAISKAFAGTGRALESSGGQRVLRGLIANGTEFAGTVLPSIGRALGAVFDLGSGKGAVTGLSQLLKGLFDGVSGFAQGLKPYIPEFNQVFEAIGKISKAVGPALAQDIGLLAKPLGWLAKFLNSRAGQPFIGVISQIVAGLVLMKGLAKILPGDLGKAFGSVKGLLGLPKLIGEKWEAVTGIPGKITSAWGKVTAFPGRVAGAWSKVFGAEGVIANSASTFAQWGSSALASASEFFTGLGGKLAAAGRATMAWLGENLTAGASFIAENLIEAASATAAFIAENAATIGLVAGIALLAGAIVYLATHWRQVWGDIKHWAEDAWRFVYDGFGKYLLPLLGPAGLIALGVIELARHWSQVWGAIKAAGEAVWHGIEDGISGFVGAVKTTWNTLESVFKVPVNFLIKTVYDDGIAKLWNDVVGAVGLGSLKLPLISGLAGGGVIPGYAPGRDSVPAMLSPGEAVLTPDATRAIGGAGTVNALNSAYAPSGGTRAPGHYSLGGIVSGIVSGVAGGAAGTARAVAALATGNTTAFVNAIAPAVGTSAAGELGRVMVAMPRTLLTDAARAAIGMTGGGSRAAPPSGGGSLTPAVRAWFDTAAQLTGVGMSWVPDLETIAQHESSLNPAAVNMSDSNAAAGDPSRGLMQVIMATFDEYHAPGTSLNIFDPVANIAAAIGYIRARYGNPGAVPGIVNLAQGGPYVGYDSGGWLPPGMTAAVNQTGRPEAVLTADEAADFKAVVRHLTEGAAGGTAAGHAPAVFNFYGTQLPTAEQQAEMDRHLSLALSGG